MFELRETVLLSVAAAIGIKLLLMAPDMYHSTDFEVHRNWMAIAHSLPPRMWYREATSIWTLDYPPLFAWFEKIVAYFGAHVDPAMVELTNLNYASERTRWVQKGSVIISDLTLVLGLIACFWNQFRSKNHNTIASTSATDGDVDTTAAAKKTDATTATTATAAAAVTQYETAAATASPVATRTRSGRAGSVASVRKFKRPSVAASAAAADGGGSSSTSSAVAPVDQRTVDSPAAVKRGSVVNSSGVLGSKIAAAQAAACTSAALVLLSPALLLVDHMHFQYNGMLLGLLLLSMGLMIQGQHVLSGVVFTVLFMMKHLYLSLAPLYFIYLLRAYCFPPAAAPIISSNSSSDRSLLVKSLARLVLLGSSVACLCVAALAPLCWDERAGAFMDLQQCGNQMRQLQMRLFPFGRGLVHAYWAPNVWAIYLSIDRVLLSAMKRLSMVPAEAFTGSITGGLAAVSPVAMLPHITPALTAVLAVGGMVPALVKVWRVPRPTTFVAATVYCALCAFMVGWHVHEKALLTALIPLTLLAPRTSLARHLYIVMSTVCLYALLPLLPQQSQCVTRTMLFVVGVGLTHCALPVATAVASRAGSISSAAVSSNSGGGGSSSSSSKAVPVPVPADEFYSVPLFASRRLSIGSSTPNSPALRWQDIVERLVLIGFVNLHAFREVVHPLLFGHWSTGAAVDSESLQQQQRQWVVDMPFLPLLLTSLYCAVCMCYCWAVSYKLVQQQQ